MRIGGETTARGPRALQIGEDQNRAQRARLQGRGRRSKTCFLRNKPKCNLGKTGDKCLLWKRMKTLQKNDKWVRFVRIGRGRADVSAVGQRPSWAGCPHHNGEEIAEKALARGGFLIDVSARRDEKEGRQEWKRSLVQTVMWMWIARS